MLPPWCDLNSKPFHCLEVVGSNSQNAKWLSSLQKRLAPPKQRYMKHIIAHHLFPQRHLHVLTYAHVAIYIYIFKSYTLVFFVESNDLGEIFQFISWYFSINPWYQISIKVSEGRSRSWWGWEGLIISTPKGRSNGVQHSLAKENLLEDPEPGDLAFQP